MAAGRQAYDGVALVAATSTEYARESGHNAHWFIGQVLRGLLATSGLGKAQIDGLAVSSFSLTPDTVVNLTEYFSLSPRWIEHLPMGGASGIIAMQRAARAVQAGDASIVACIAGETAGKASFRALLSSFSRFSSDAVYPYGGGGANGIFAMITRHYMERFGATREDFGRICVAQRHNAVAYPPALQKKPLSMAEYLAARPIAEPLHLYDCVLPCCGGEGFLVMPVAMAGSLDLPYARILSTGEVHNAYFDDDMHFRGGWALYRDELYANAGLGPGDIDILETYDDYPVICMLQMEGLGFCDTGGAAAFIRATDLRFDGGGLPHNTSGGQLSVGQAGSAGGYLGIVEAIRQLTHTSLPHSVPGAVNALVSGYGMVNYDRCLCTSAAILTRGNA